MFPISSTSVPLSGKVMSRPFVQKSCGVFMKGGLILILLALVLVLGPSPVNSSSGGIPTFSIQSVRTDQTVTILTQNFPAGQTFAVTMGPMGTLGINGYQVASTNSGAGGSFTATYTIPEQLKGAYQISIRLQSGQGYYSYNWFYNNTTGGAPGLDAALGTTTGYTGIPTFDIETVDTDKTVTIQTKNFPPNQTFTVMMGAMGTAGVNGVPVGKIESGAGGTMTKTFDIPDQFKGDYRIAIRAQTGHAVNPFYAYNWFNNTAPAANATPAAPAVQNETPVVTAVYTSIPTIRMCSVVQDKTVMFRTNNFPPNQTFTVTMGWMGTAGLGGTVVGTFDSGTGGTFEKTFNIPAHLAGFAQIAVRAQTVHANPYYAYNWFYNDTASVCN